MQIATIARLHTDIDAITIQLWIDLVRLGGIHQFLEDIAGPDAPAFGLDGDIGGRVIVRLQQIVGR